MSAADSSAFNVIIVGAGEINFGSVEGPWNHSLRLERLLGARLRVLAIVDHDSAKANSQLEGRKKQSETPQAWQHTLVAADCDDARRQLPPDTVVHLVVLGIPPHFRGSMHTAETTAASAPRTDAEMQVLSAFPSLRALLIEKPVAAVRPSESASDPHGLQALAKALSAHSAEHGTMIGVGYMMRYLKAVRMLWRTIQEQRLHVTCINARYYMAYEYARKLAWWNKSASCGPVVEQATHFVDLMRHIMAACPLPDGDTQPDEPLFSSIHTHTVEHDEPAGQLRAKRFDEEQVPPADRLPRVTSAHWKWRRSGAIGTLLHVIGLHGATPYDTQLEVLADGWIFTLKDAYASKPKLYVREPGAMAEKLWTDGEDDPFLAEVEAMVSAVDAMANGESTKAAGAHVLSTFEDALKTYELTWAIREAGDRLQAERMQAHVDAGRSQNAC